MQFSIVKFFAAFFGVMCSIQLSLAFPILPRAIDAIEARDVFVPPVLEPNSSNTWVIGTTETVVW